LAEVEPISVLLAVQARVNRDALAAVLGREEAIDVVGACDDPDEVMPLVHELEPDVLLVDAALLADYTLLRAEAGAAKAHGREAPARLTARELEIFELIHEGYSNKEIARALSIELATVKNHVHHVLEKLGVTRRGQAAALLRHTGVLH
jgi:DNA-binding NarL/FixJ family response regulator